jgi:hypothetical protein
MIRISLKAHRFAAVFLCIAVAAPTRTLAQVEAKPQFDVLEDSAGTAASKVPTRPDRPGATSEPKFLDEEELAALSQRNQNPGPEVRGGALSNEHLTYIVIALAAIVLVLVLK